VKICKAVTKEESVLTESSWAEWVSAGASVITMLVAGAPLSNWRSQLENQTADKCLADAKLYEGAFNRYLALRSKPKEEIDWNQKVAAYDYVWLSLRNLTASYEVARRYHKALKSTDIDAECVKQIRKVPLVKTSDADDRGTAQATGSMSWAPRSTASS
jgi:hypothetical protein